MDTVPVAYCSSRTSPHLEPSFSSNAPASAGVRSKLDVPSLELADLTEEEQRAVDSPILGASVDEDEDDPHAPRKDGLSASSPPLGPPVLGIEVEAAHRTKVFSNFYAFSHIMEKEFSTQAEIDSARISQFFARFHFNPVEWRQFACCCHGKYTRNLVSS